MARARIASLGGLTALALSIAGCTALPGVFPTPTAPSPVPLNLPELRSLLLDVFGEVFFCDPDFYPVATGDEAELALERFPAIAADSQEFPVLLRRLGIEAVPPFSPEEQLGIYREHKKLAAVALETEGNRYRFTMRVTDGQTIEALEGTIDRFGRIGLESRQPSSDMCPICLVAGTRISTPGGPVAVELLRVGDLVWSLDGEGRTVAVPVVRTGSSPVPPDHMVIRLRLEDGRLLFASPGHPLADGSSLLTLHIGSWIGGSVVEEVGLGPYASAFTYDILPGSETGWYWAEGILLGSTLNGGGRWPVAAGELTKSTEE
jgi:hypothetical protein